MVCKVIFFFFMVSFKQVLQAREAYVCLKPILNSHSAFAGRPTFENFVVK